MRWSGAAARWTMQELAASMANATTPARRRFVRFDARGRSIRSGAGHGVFSGNAGEVMITSDVRYQRSKAPIPNDLEWCNSTSL
jgi:hypothetical protein